ncbi:hypothetical protein NPIL_697211, partial [Nephila pilipes]
PPLQETMATIYENLIDLGHVLSDCSSSQASSSITSIINLLSA